MTTQKQIKANQRNAQKSTGPQSPRGKAVARMNALKHGFLAEQVVIPGEDDQEFFDLRRRFLDELGPDGVLERELVDQVVVTFWRLRRVRRVEAGIFVSQLEPPKRTPRREHGIFGDIFPMDKAPPEEEEEEEEEDQTDPRHRALRLLGNSFIRDANGANALSKLSRYETALHRSLQRDLHELERLQDRRKGTAVQAPMAVDVMIDGALPLAENEP